MTGEEDIHILGAYIGPEPANYPKARVDEEIRHLSDLCGLPAQHGLLLLRLSLQHRLRHLLRTLPATERCKDQWLRLDEAVQREVLRMRGVSQLTALQDAKIITLPLRKGGLGLFSAADTAAHAREASLQASDSSLDLLLKTTRMEGAVIRTQRDRCSEMLDLQHKTLANTLKGVELLQFADITAPYHDNGSMPFHIKPTTNCRMKLWPSASITVLCSQDISTRANTAAQETL